MEEWKQIDGYPNYMISSSGRVMSLNYMGKGKARILNPTTKGRYLKVGLRNDDGYKTFRVHRLVAEAFVEKQDGKDFVDHIDGNRGNCVAENLRWTTPAENSANPSTYPNYFNRYHREGEWERRSQAQKKRFREHPETHWQNKKKNPPRLFS